MDKWEVVLSRYSDHICVNVQARGVHLSNVWDSDVYAPNFIERLLGITYSKKLKKAIAHQQKIADKLNKKEDLVRQEMDRYENKN